MKNNRHLSSKYKIRVAEPSITEEDAVSMYESVKNGFLSSGPNVEKFEKSFADYIGNKMFAFLVNVFFGGRWTDSLNESRIITRKAFNELKFDSFKMGSTQQMSIRGLKLNHKICEIVGNEGVRIGGKRKMAPLQVGADLSLQILKEFFHW